MSIDGETIRWKADRKHHNGWSLSPLTKLHITTNGTASYDAIQYELKLTWNPSLQIADKKKEENLKYQHKKRIGQIGS